MGLDIQYCAYLSGQRAHIDALYAMLTPKAGDGSLLPKGFIAPQYASAHAQLHWRKDEKMGRVRKDINRPYPFPLSLSEIQASKSPDDCDKAGQAPKGHGQISTPRLLAAVLTAQNIPDIPAEHLHPDTIALINNTLNNWADANVSMVRHELPGDRAVLEIVSGWTRQRYASCYHLFPVLYAHAAVPFDLIDMTRVEMDNARDYQAGRAGMAMVSVPPLGCRYVRDPHGFDGVPTYSYRRRLAAAGFDQDVLSVVFGTDHATHRKLHQDCIMQSRALIREGRKAALLAQNPQQTPSSKQHAQDEIPF